MEQQHLEAYLALAETLHFGKAANLLHTSPSTLTRTIQRLEEQIGQPLFERDKRTVALTEAGRLFYEYAESSLAQWENYKRLIATQTAELSGELSIFCSVTAVYSILARILRPFRTRYPQVKIKLSTGDVADAIAQVQEKKVQIAIAARPDNLPYDIDFMNLVTTPLELIAPLNIGDLPALATDGSLNWESVPVILSDRGLSRDRFLQWCKVQKITPNIFAQVAGNEAIIAMVSLGFGIGVVPNLVLQKSPMRESLKTLTLSPALKPYDVGLAIREKNLQDPLVKAFREVARDVL